MSTEDGSISVQPGVACFGFEYLYMRIIGYMFVMELIECLFVLSGWFWC